MRDTRGLRSDPMPPLGADGQNGTPSLPSPPAWVLITSSLIRRLPAGRYRAIARVSTLRARPFLMKLPRDAGGYRFTCDLADSICRDVCFTGMYEPQETMLLRSILRPGMVFLDVGANWGYFSLVAAHQVGSSGSVISLEPHPVLFSRLAGNVAENRLDQVTALSLAAGAEKGSETLVGWESASDNWGVSSFSTLTDRGGPKFTVDTCPVDELESLRAFQFVDLVKMDIEGAEGVALAGMSRGLATHRYRRLLIELHPSQLARQGREPRDLLNLLRGYGYSIFKVDHSPQATRASAYSRPLNITELVKPFAATDALDAWPHLLCLAPGVVL